jgi:hypothetical protein
MEHLNHMTMMNKGIMKVLTNDKNSQYVYEPLFGEKAAFRLKGIATTDSGINMV